MKSRIIRVKASAVALRLPTGILASHVRSIIPFRSGFDIDNSYIGTPLRDGNAEMQKMPLPPLSRSPTSRLGSIELALRECQVRWAARFGSAGSYFQGREFGNAPSRIVRNSNTAQRKLGRTVRAAECATLPIRSRRFLRAFVSEEQKPSAQPRKRLNPEKTDKVTEIVSTPP